MLQMQLQWPSSPLLRGIWRQMLWLLDPQVIEDLWLDSVILAH